MEEIRLEGVVALFIPISLFVCIAVTVCIYFYLASRARLGVQTTIRAAIEHGQALSPELIDRLGEQRRTPESDLRRGVVLIALGLGIAAFGAILGEQDAVQPMLAIGAVPFLVGVAFVGLWRLMPRR